MGSAYFYHLTESSLEQTLPQLIGRARQAGWRSAVRRVDAAHAEQLDTALWAGPDDGFLPHGVAGGAHDALQPVLIGLPETDFGNGAQCLMAVGGVDVSPEDVAAHERLCVLFDGHDEAALNTARAQWKTLTGAGCSAQYWAQEGGWVKKAESA